MDTKQVKHQCSVWVGRGYFTTNTRCGINATVQVGDKWYCWRHNPHKSTKHVKR